MLGKRHSPERILRKLREVEVALARGETAALESVPPRKYGLVRRITDVRPTFNPQVVGQRI
jgi:hypothetical protein